MAKTANLALRIAPEIKDALDQAAKADRRSVSSLVEKILAEFLKDQGFLKHD